MCLSLAGGAFLSDGPLAKNSKTKLSDVEGILTVATSAWLAAQSLAKEVRGYLKVFFFLILVLGRAQLLGELHHHELSHHLRHLLLLLVRG